MKFQVWAYGMQGCDDMLDGEYDTLEEALDIVRREWPYPMKLILPNGQDYDFTKHGDEWKEQCLYNYIVLNMPEKLNVRQNLLLKEIEKDPDLKFFLRLMKKPRNYSEITNDDDPDFKLKKMETLLKLIHCNLIEFAIFSDGGGLVDPKWRR